jgi:hypothetical protein
MEALAGLGILYAIFWVVGALVILSIAIDAARCVRLAKKTVELLEQQNRHLSAIAVGIVNLSSKDEKQAA